MLDSGFCARSILCTSRPHCVTFTADGALLVSAHFDGALRVWDAASGSLVAEVKGVHTAPMTAVCATPVAHRVVGCGRDNVLSVVDVARSQVRIEWIEHATRRAQPSSDADSPAQVVRRFHDALAFQVGQSKCSPCVSPDGAVVAAGSSSGNVLLMSIADGTIHAKLAAHKAPVTCVAWNSRAEDYAACAASVDKAGDVVFWGASEARVNSWYGPAPSMLVRLLCRGHSSWPDRDAGAGELGA